MAINWKKIKAINDMGIVRYFYPDYKVNKWIFNVTMFIVLLLGLTALYQSSFNFKMSVHVSCDYDAPCENPFYFENYDKAGISREECPDQELCLLEKLPPHSSFGRETPFLAKNYDWISISLIIIAILLNHFIYNKGFKFKFDEDENQNGPEQQSNQ